MLVLNRKEADSIVINGTIRIKVLRIKRSTICLGIDAPLDVSVLRSELAPRPDAPAEQLSPPRASATFCGAVAATTPGGLAERAVAAGSDSLRLKPTRAGGRARANRPR